MNGRKLINCVAKFDDARQGIFKLGGVSVNNVPVPGWKMDAVFQTLKEHGYDVMNYSQMKDGFFVFVGHRLEAEKNGWADSTHNPARNYFRFFFHAKDKAPIVDVSHSFGSMHDIPLKDMKKVYESTSDDKLKPLTDEERRAEYDRLSAFRESHTLPSVTFSMKDADIRGIVDAVLTEIEYIEDEWW